MHQTATKSQQQAIEHIGVTFCDAGAGSGKTYTLISKIAYLILHHELDPRRILAITFTNRAAEELKERLLPTLEIPASRFSWVLTFHGACYRILQTHCEKMGFRKPMQVFNDYKQKKIMRTVLSDLNIDKKYVPWARSRISLAKNIGTVERLKGDRIGNTNLLEIYDEYMGHLKSHNAMDFDDLLMFTRELLLLDETLRIHYQNLFQYILLDESQDSNTTQFDIIQLLINPQTPRFFSCGDDWQSLYGFRGASLDRYLNLQSNYNQCRVIRLEENFRSRNNIVQAGNTLIKNNKKRTQKNCYSTRPGGLICGKEHLDEDVEASWVAKKIIQANTKGIPFSEIAVLYRVNAMSRSIEMALQTEQIPYKLIGGVGFYERAEVMDLIAYLSAGYYENDLLSFERALGVPRRGIGPATLEKIKDKGLQAGFSGIRDAMAHCLNQKLLPDKQHEALTEFAQLLHRLQQQQPGPALQDLIGHIDFMRHLEIKYGDGQATEAVLSRQDNIIELTYSAQRYESISAFLEDVDLYYGEKKYDPADEDKASLMTIHKSKGTEFSCVFVLGCEESTLPHSRSLNLQGSLRTNAIEEERRLMYVAATRAKDELALNWCAQRQGRDVGVSRFIGEMCDYVDIETD